MAKRFIDNEIFKKLRPLKGPYKLLYIYIFCECNHAGIWHMELEIAAIRLGFDYNEKDVIEALGDKIRKIGDNKWYLTDFVEFQYGELKEGNRVHQSVIHILNKHKIKPLKRPLKGCKDKDKDKDKDNINILKGRIGPWLNRRSNTKWSDKEVRALRQIGDISDDELDLLEHYYTAYHVKGEDYRRKSVQTLLNNWSGELDRARNFQPLRQPVAKLELIEPGGWIEAYKIEMGHSRFEKDWTKLSEQMKKEIIEYMKGFL